MTELLSSDFTLIGAALAGLALTSLAILRDLGRLELGHQDAAKLAALGDTP